VFENAVLRIFGPNRDKVVRGWSRLHNEKLSSAFITKYYSGDQIKKNGIGGACGTYRGEGMSI
jgi:hypothetical protein